VKPLWFTKSRRAQNVDDYETWIEGGVMPTLNAFDNGDIRSTVIIFYGNRVDDIRLQGGVINTLQARMGTGGNNMPMIFSHTQGLDPQPSEEVSPTLRMNGNGMAVAHAIQGTVIGRSDTAGPAGKGYGEADDPMFTIDTVGGHAVATENQVRRLTPLECERLQGFPDDWTASQSDSARYKQMGNAVAVPVVEWIIQGIVDTLI